VLLSLRVNLNAALVTIFLFLYSYLHVGLHSIDCESRCV